MWFFSMKKFRGSKKVGKHKVGLKESSLFQKASKGHLHNNTGINLSFRIPWKNACMQKKKFLHLTEDRENIPKKGKPYIFYSIFSLTE